MANSFGSFYADASGGEGVVTYLTCQSCGAEVEYSKKEDYDEADA